MDPDPCSVYQHTCAIPPRHFSTALRRCRLRPQAGDHAVFSLFDRDFQVTLVWCQVRWELPALLPGVDRSYDASEL